MNQYIKIRYKPQHSNPNYWKLWFYLPNSISTRNKKRHREKSPSCLNSDGYWNWCIHDKIKKEGKDFDWSKS